MKDKSMSIDDLIREVVRQEAEANKKLADLKSKYNQVFMDLAVIEAQLDECQRVREGIKKTLIEDGDFDLHKVDGVKVSVCPIVKLAVKNINDVEEKYKTTEVVVDTKKAQEAMKLFGEVPAGFEDKTYHRFTWKGKDDK